MGCLLLEAGQNRDNEFFEHLTKVVFYTGFHRGVVERKWAYFQAAFCQFAIPKVAAFGEPEIENLLQKDSQIVKNARKVRATVENANICLGILEEYGSLERYLSAMRDEKRTLEGEFRRRFRLVGENAAHSLLHDLQNAAYL